MRAATLAQKTTGLFHAATSCDLAWEKRTAVFDVPAVQRGFLQCVPSWHEFICLPLRVDVSLISSEVVPHTGTKLVGQNQGR